MSRRVEIEGLDTVLRQFNVLGRELRKEANGELRTAARKIADGLQAKIQAGSGPAPQSAAVAKTARARNDRMVVVKVPGVNIPFASGSVGGTRRGSIAYGVEYGPAGAVNYYKVPRGGDGYMVKPKVEDHMGKAEDDYKTALVAILRKYGLLGAAGAVR